MFAPIKRLIRFFFVPIIAACLVPTAQSAEPFKYRIKLTISGKRDEDYRSRLESALNRELRTLGDVAVVETDPFYELMVLSLKLRNQGGVSTGYALASVVIRHYNFAESHDALKRLTPDRIRAAGLPIEDYFRATAYTGIPPQIPYFYTTSIYSGSELEALCKELVANFDADALIPERKMAQQIQDMLDNAMKAAQKKQDHPPQP